MLLNKSRQNVDIAIQDDDNFDTLQVKLSKKAAQAAELVEEGDIGDGSTSDSHCSAEIAKAFWGYAIYDIASTDKPQLKYGSVNRRPVDAHNVAKLAAAMLHDGIRRISKSTAIPVIVPKSCLVDERRCKEFKEKGDDYPPLEEVVVKGLREVQALGGQHRRDAIKANIQWAQKIMKGATDRLTQNFTDVLLLGRASEDKTASKTLRKQAEKKRGAQDMESARIEREIGLAKSLVKWKGQWLVKIYVDGKY